TAPKAIAYGKECEGASWATTIVKIAAEISATEMPAAISATAIARTPTIATAPAMPTDRSQPAHRTNTAQADPSATPATISRIRMRESTLAEGSNIPALRARVHPP